MSDSAALGEVVQKTRKDAIFFRSICRTPWDYLKKKKQINNGRDLTPMTT